MIDQFLPVNVITDDNDVVGRRDGARSQVDEQNHRVAMRHCLHDSAGGAFFDAGGRKIARGEFSHVRYQGSLERLAVEFFRGRIEGDIYPVIVENHRQGSGAASKNPLVEWLDVQHSLGEQGRAAPDPVRDGPGTGKTHRQGQDEKCYEPVANDSRLIL